MKKINKQSIIQSFFKIIVILFESFADIYKKDILRHAAVLSFQTLFSLIPLIYLSIYIVSFFFELPNQRTIFMLLSKYFIPDVAQKLTYYIFLILSKIDIHSLGISGMSFLILITVFMGLSLERSVNAIWRIEKESSSKRRILYHILGIGITPFIIFIPIYYGYRWLGSTFNILNKPIMFFSLCLILSLMYMVLPRTKVRFVSAIIGAIISSALYEITKIGFSYYFRLITGPLYYKIYGAIYFIPACIVWLYLSWIIFLLGSNISYKWQMER